MAESSVAVASSGGSGTRSCRGSSTPADNYILARRRTLQVVVSSLLTEAGFDSAEKAAVETLTEMLQSYLTEVGRSAKSYCEHTTRTQPTLPDIVVSLIEMGFNVDTLPAYAKRSQRMVITAPPVTNNPVVPKALIAGLNKPHPAHIPGHLPDFPDPHTYIKTPTCREPVADYQVLREKAASQRRDVERALTRFMAKTGETQSLFKDDTSTFPCFSIEFEKYIYKMKDPIIQSYKGNAGRLYTHVKMPENGTAQSGPKEMMEKSMIAARSLSIPYLNALLPSELELQQVEETDSSEQDDQTDNENLSMHLQADETGAEKENSSVLQQNSMKGGEETLIDNPYLRPVKKPKLRRKK